MRKVLVPVKLSKTLEAAKNAAVFVADKTGAEIHFLYVAEEQDNGNKNILNREKLEKLASQIKDISTKTFITEGVPYDDIISHTEEEKIDLIIFCSDGTSGYHESYTAGNLLRVTRLSGCPVLIVPQDYDFKSLNKIIFASDFTFETDYREKVLEVCKALKKLTQAFDPHIDLLFIDTENCNHQKILSCMEEFGGACEIYGVGFKIEKADTVDEGIVSFTKRNKSDAIAIIGHGSGSYYTQLRTSISEKLIEKAKVPVIIFRLEN
jgi:nucleotide-binding universal stress UspA family protein